MTPDREARFLAALEHAHLRLLARARAQIEREPPERALLAALTALIGFLAAEPRMARVMTLEALCAGAPALDARDAAIATIAQLIEGAYAGLPSEVPVPDIAPAVALGGVQRVLAMRLRRGEHAVADILAELTDWIESYSIELGRHRWRTLQAHPPLPVAESPPPLPMPAIPGRVEVERDELLESHRQRVLYATAQVVARKGYRDATIDDIVSLAALDGRAFYRLFKGKEAAFLAVLEVYFQHVMSVSAGTFFGPGEWPRRIWAAGCAFTRCVDRHETLARVSFIESYCAGPATVRRVEELSSAFTLFLQEGYDHARRARRSPSATALRAVAASNFELSYHQTRRGLPSSSLLQHFTHLALAPFLGPAAANTLIARLAEETSSSSSTTTTTAPSR